MWSFILFADFVGLVISGLNARHTKSAVKSLPILEIDAMSILKSPSRNILSSDLNLSEINEQFIVKNREKN